MESEVSLTWKSKFMAICSSCIVDKDNYNFDILRVRKIAIRVNIEEEVEDEVCESIMAHTGNKTDSAPWEVTVLSLQIINTKNCILCDYI